MIVATPLDIPKVEPDNWDLFWDIWNEHSRPLVKKFYNNQSDVPVKDAPNYWKGLDIFDVQPGTAAWEAPLFDCRKLFPNMFSSIFSVGFPTLSRVRLISSQMHIASHSDDKLDRWNVRAFFHYTDDKPQWYYTKPDERDIDKQYIKMPEDTNWFSYNDKHVWHGSDYIPDKPKILLQIYSYPIFSNHNLIQRSIEKYKDYTVEIL